MEEKMEALYQKKNSENLSSKCLLCPHKCLIKNGQYGLCGGRKNINGTIHLLSLPTTGHLDPIEKKPLYHFYPNSKIASFGSEGCNLKCKFCQNWTISQFKAPDKDNLEEITEKTIQNIIKIATNKQDGNIGCAYTYNEPSISFEYILKASEAIHNAGMKNVLVTNGYLNAVPQKRLLKYIDALNLDVKSFDDSFYKNYCSASLKPVLRYAERAKEYCLVEITTLVIPTLNDSKTEIKKTAKWIAKHLGDDTPYHLSAYYPNYKLDIDATKPEKLIELRKYAMEYLKYVYTGNIYDEEGKNTYCPSCSKPVIVRGYGYSPITEINLKGNKCKFCGETINLKTW